MPDMNIDSALHLAFFGFCVGFGWATAVTLIRVTVGYLLPTRQDSKE